MKIQPINYLTYGYNAKTPNRISKPQQNVSFAGYREEFLRLNKQPIKDSFALRNTFRVLSEIAKKEGKIESQRLSERMLSSDKLVDKLGDIMTLFTSGRIKETETIISKFGDPLVVAQHGGVIFKLPGCKEEIGFCVKDNTIYTFKDKEYTEFYNNENIKKRKVVEGNTITEEFFRKDGTRYTPGFFDALKDIFGG